MTMSAGNYTKHDRDRFDELEREFRIIRDDEARRVHENPWGHLKTAATRIGFQPNPRD